MSSSSGRRVCAVQGDINQVRGELFVRVEFLFLLNIPRVVSETHTKWNSVEVYMCHNVVPVLSWVLTCARTVLGWSWRVSYFSPFSVFVLYMFVSLILCTEGSRKPLVFTASNTLMICDSYIVVVRLVAKVIC